MEKKQFLEYISPSSDEVDITTKDILVSIGRGIKEKDNIVYLKGKGELACSRIHHSIYIGAIKKYYTTDENNKINSNPIYENQIVGKIVKIVDNNLWNTISMKIWDISINELNVNALFAE